MELEERIKELQEMFIRKKSYQKKLEEANTEWIYLKERKNELYLVLENDDVKIRDLESNSIIYLWYDLFISKGKDVSEEMHEYKMVFDLFDFINSEISELKNKIARIDDFYDEYNTILKEKEELILENDKEKYEKIKKINQESNKYKNHIRNINDSLNALNHLKNALDYLLELLKKSKNWDTFDIFGRGLFLNLTKTSLFKKTDDRIKNLLYLTNKFIRELKVLNYYLDLQFDVSLVIKFYDYFLEDLYFDLIDNSRIFHTIEVVKSTHNILGKIKDYLNVQKEDYLKQLINIENERRKLLS